MVVASSQTQHSDRARLAAFRTTGANPALIRKSTHSFESARELRYRSAHAADSWHSINGKLRTHRRMDVEMHAIQLAPIEKLRLGCVDSECSSVGDKRISVINPQTEESSEGEAGLWSRQCRKDKTNGV